MQSHSTSDVKNDSTFPDAAFSRINDFAIAIFSAVPTSDDNTNAKHIERLTLNLQHLFVDKEVIIYKQTITYINLDSPII